MVTFPVLPLTGFIFLNLFGLLECLVMSLRKRLRIRSVISEYYHYITVLCPFNFLIRFKCYNAVINKF